MNEINSVTVDFGNPYFIAGMIALLLLSCLFLLIVLALRASTRAAKSTEPLKHQIEHLGDSFQRINDGQNQLAGGLKHVSEANAMSQAQMLHTVEKRLEEVQRSMVESLHGTSSRTSKSLGELQQRLVTIDQAQANIEKLSGNVLGLQDILSNKQTRGAFGEIQLNDIVSKALPSDAYSFQPTLSNGKRPDCIVHLPNPPGDIVIDSKFPLEGFEAMIAAKDDTSFKQAVAAFRTSVKTHIKDISEKYIIEGETADGALMFLPSEAIYAELHANFPALVREGFEARVWIVSPTTCMATLNTLRSVLKDVRMREQAGAIRKELALLYKDVERLEGRVQNLDKHFSMAQKDIDEIKISAQKSGMRSRRLDSFDFDDTKETLDDK